MRYLLRVELAVKYKCGINQRQMMRLFEVTICDLKDGGINGKEGTGADNRYDRISNGAEAYTFLGTANYVQHEGEKPMNITWKLDSPIPAKYLKKTNKLVVG